MDIKVYKHVPASELINTIIDIFNLAHDDATWVDLYHKLEMYCGCYGDFDTMSFCYTPSRVMTFQHTEIAKYIERIFTDYFENHKVIVIEWR